MTLPKKIYIKGRPWAIGYKWRLHDKDLGECAALADWEANTIWIDRTLPKEERLGYLLHEIVHIILDEYHMHETGGITDSFLEEVLCTGISKTLLDVFDLKFKKQVV